MTGDEVRPLVRRQVVVELELVPDLGPHVLALVHQPVKERDQLHQLVIRAINEPRLDGDTILQLVPECLEKYRF